ncbi:queuosine precursor transporter [Aliiroseovarius crassostreae]|uniref:Probable queuosine precursor transporter n=1 Tax=Aliiroseovarius crassostreae TaxID=154981 RepID=A0A9Q9HE11_9RHOB|nr:queuosine precursor transporter [Aliiroseovarius crassostreae]UWP95512.1 queuosine precursor transporter [Aliiroseovarius crassostreae]
MTRILPGVIAMAAVVVASNILVQFLLLDGLLTWGAFTYPLAFLVTDVMNRVYGAGPARKVVFAGFVVGVICSLIGSQIMLQGEGFEYAAVPLRVAVASGAGFLTAQLLDVAVFNSLRDGKWWRAPLASTLVGSVVDTVLFFTIAFSASITFFGADADAAINWAWDPARFLTFGPKMPLWVSLAVADWLVKLTLALVALIPFRVIVTKLSPSVA